MTFMSYAQNLEDVMLWRALRHVERGFYIDVGAQHPVIDSVTKAFYEKGWRGINIDPVPAWVELLREDRPHDITLQLALGAEEGRKEMFDVRGTGLSTDRAEFLQRYIEEGFKADPIVVDVHTLEQVCTESDVKQVHFLKVDVEGAELDVLKGFSFSTIRPWIVLLEAIEPVVGSEGGESTQVIYNYQVWEPLLLSHGYHFVYDDGLNRYYIANERAELDDHFRRPPNPADAFIRYEEWRKHERILELEGKLHTLKDAFDTAALKMATATLDEWRVHDTNRLRRIAELEQEEMGLHEQVASLSGSLDEARRDAANRLQYISVLENERSNLQGQVHVLTENAVRSEEEGKRFCGEVAELYREVAERYRQIEIMRKAQEDSDALREAQAQELVLLRERQIHLLEQLTIQLEEKVKWSLGHHELEMDYSEERNQLKADLINLQKQFAILQAEKLQWISAQQDLGKAYEREAQARAEFSSRLESEIARNADLTRSLHEVTSSHSWRLTKPLRLLRRMLSKGSHMKFGQRQVVTADSTRPIIPVRWVHLAKSASQVSFFRRAAALLLAFSPQTKRRIVAAIMDNRSVRGWGSSLQANSSIDSMQNDQGKLMDPGIEAVSQRLKQHLDLRKNK